MDRAAPDGLDRAVATFLFTDIEGHTTLWEQDAPTMSAALALHDELVTAAVVGADGAVVKCDGDSVMAVFDEPAAAVDAAADAQRRLATAAWPGAALSVRMGLHTGSAIRRDDDWYGPEVIRAARLCDAAHGGQVVASAIVAQLAPTHTWLDLGAHRLRGLVTPERVQQLVIGDQRTQFPPLRNVDRGADRLPAERTSFVGRADDVQVLVAAIVQHRLVTVTGIGGGGKTRLAIEAARRRASSEPDGADFVDLTGASDRRTVVNALADALGLAIDGDDPRAVEDRVRRYLSGRSALLVLDNCEHVVEDVADVVDRILDDCAHVRVLATSREPLGLDGEQVVHLSAMTIDDAVALFEARSSTSHDQATVREVCRRLDGIPLAVELAAARTSHLSINEIARLLDDRFLLLTGGVRRTSRQRTLEATLDWSYDLLSPPEAALLRRLSVFAGETVLGAVQQLVGGSAIEVVDLLGRLVDRSLVEHDPATGRYWMLETVRAYAGQRLVDAGEGPEWRTRHRDRILESVERLPLDEVVLVSDTSRSLLSEARDLRAALSWSIEAGEWDAAARLVVRLPAVMALDGSTEVSPWAERILANVEVGSETAYLALVAALAGSLYAGSMSGGPVFDRGDDGGRVRLGLERLASMAHARSDSMATCILASTGFAIVTLALSAGDATLGERGREMVREAVRRTELDDDGSAWRAATYGTAAQLSLVELDVAAACRFLRRAVSADSAAGTQAHLAQLALCLHLTDDDDALTVALAAARAPVVAAVGFDAVAAVTLELSRRGERAAALAELARGLAELERASRLEQAVVLTVGAGVVIYDGDLATAARWLGCAAQHGGVFTTPTGFALHRALVAQVRSGLPPEVARQLRAEGRALPFDDGLAELVARLGPVDRPRR